MRTPVLLLVGSVAFVAVSMTVLTSNVGTVFHHPRSPNDKFVIRGGKVIHVTERIPEEHPGSRASSGKRVSESPSLEPPASSHQPPASSPAHEGPPRIIAPETTFDFGVMNPLAMGGHDFVIRNQGQRPLTLEAAETTCKCTVGRLERNVLRPGEQTTLRIEWNTGGKLADYSHGALIRTNDPETDYVWFRVEGKVRRRLVCTPSDFEFGSISPVARESRSAYLLSDVWDRFEVNEIESSLPNLRWTVSPVDGKTTEGLRAAAAREIKVTLPDDLPEGPFHHWLRASVVAADGERESLEMSVTGKVTKRICVHGKEIDQRGVIDLGRVLPDGDRQVTLIVKVHDPRPEIGDAPVVVEPSYVSARLDRIASPGSDAALYKLTVEVPSRARRLMKRSEESGTLRLDIDHPRLEPLELKLRFEK